MLIICNEINVIFMLWVLCHAADNTIDCDALHLMRELNGFCPIQKPIDLKKSENLTLYFGARLYLIRSLNLIIILMIYNPSTHSTVKPRAFNQQRVQNLNSNWKQIQSKLEYHI